MSIKYNLELALTKKNNVCVLEWNCETFLAKTSSQTFLPGKNTVISPGVHREVHKDILGNFLGYGFLEIYRDIAMSSPVFHLCTCFRLERHNHFDSNIGLVFFVLVFMPIFSKRKMFTAGEIKTTGT